MDEPTTAQVRCAGGRLCVSPCFNVNRSHALRVACFGNEAPMSTTGGAFDAPNLRSSSMQGRSTKKRGRSQPDNATLKFSIWEESADGDENGTIKRAPMSARMRSRPCVHTLARVYTHALSRTTMDAEHRDLTDEELGRVIIRNRRIRLRSGVNPSWHVKAAVISHDAPDGSAFTVLTYPPVVHAIGHAAFKQLAMDACWSADVRLRASARVSRMRVCLCAHR